MKVPARIFAICLLAFIASGCAFNKTIPVAMKADQPGTETLNPKLQKKMDQHKAGNLKRFDKPDQAQAFFLKKRSPDGKSPLPMDRYVVAREQASRMQRYSTALGGPVPATDRSGAPTDLGAWTWLGPGNIGGRSRALIIDPNDHKIFYTGGVAGGVWKSTNSGETWVPLTDLLANIAVNSMAMDPANSNILYAGTGEGYFNGDAARGLGIFKTSDAGATWEHLANTANSNFHYVNDLVISPNNSSNIYASTRTGVWRSTNAGVDWTQVHNPGVLGGCMDMEVRTDQATDYIFVACGTFTANTIYRNTDAAGAGTWDSVFTDPCIARTTLAVAPSNQNIIYALASENCIPELFDALHAVYRSDSSGDSGTWNVQVDNTDPVKLNTVLLTNPVFAHFPECGFGPDPFFFNQGWYDNVIAVDPVNPDIVWAGGIDLFRSNDGGQNWGIASHWWGDTAFDPSFSHADQHRIVFHPNYNGGSNQIMYAGSDGGVYRTNNSRAAVATGPTATCDPGNGSVNWTALNNNYGVTQFYHGVPYPAGDTYFGGTQDNGTVRGSNASGQNAWNMIQGGDGGYVAVDPNNTNVLYAEFTGISITKSTDGGATFNDAFTGITDPGMFINPFIMDPGESQRLWTGNVHMWRTTNAAANWVQASTPVNGEVSAIAVFPTNGDLVLAGTDTGFVHRTNTGLSADSTTVWASVQPRAGYVSWVAHDPNDSNTAYATYSTFGGTHVWKSTDGGATWAGIDGTIPNNIPDIPVHSIIVDPSNSARLFIGTDTGVFVTTDGGGNWSVENTGFANTITESLSISGNQLFAFTHGRGAFRVSTGACLLCDEFNDGVIDPNWTYEKGTWTENGQELVGQHTRKAIAYASPIFAGCTNCDIHTTIQTAGGPGNKAWVLGWRQDKQNVVELLMKEENDRWILKQRVNGRIVKKAKGVLGIEPNVPYNVSLSFDGNAFNVTINGVSLINMTKATGSNPTGTVGYQSKNTQVIVDRIEVQ